VYSKSVDVWSCGIIMYMLLHKGKHPLYQEGDNYSTYAEKLHAPNWALRSDLSEMALNLFRNLTHQMSIHRYGVK
jgi:serine/threonine protein kinase